MLVFGPPILSGGKEEGSIPQKSLLGFLLPADTHHVLKFRKDPFRGFDKIGSIGSNISYICKKRRLHYMVAADEFKKKNNLSTENVSVQVKGSSGGTTLVIHHISSLLSKNLSWCFANVAYLKEPGPKPTGPLHQARCIKPSPLLPNYLLLYFFDYPQNHNPASLSFTRSPFPQPYQ